MKLAVLIIGQNQNDYIGSMLEKLAGLEADRYWVLDRCTDDSASTLAHLGETNVITNQEGSGFLAGKMRDLGLDTILLKEYDAVLFLDGDRIPLAPITTKQVKRALAGCDVSLCSLEADIRVVRPFKRVHNFKPNQFVTCGFIATTTSLKAVRELFFMEGRCFHKNFDGRYGYEDGFFGKLLFDMGYTIAWNNIVVSGAIIFDDIVKMKTLREQEDVFSLLVGKYSVVAE